MLLFCFETINRGMNALSVFGVNFVFVYLVAKSIFQRIGTLAGADRADKPIIAAPILARLAIVEKAEFGCHTREGMRSAPAPNTDRALSHGPIHCPSAKSEAVVLTISSGVTGLIVS